MRARSILLCLTGAVVCCVPGDAFAQAANDAPAADTWRLARAATPPMMDMRAISVGTGLAAGLAGVEITRRLGLRTGIGFGFGAGGVGGRAFVTPFEAVGRVHTWVPYAAAEAMYAPWRWGSLDAPGGIGATVGLQRWGADGDWFGDVGIGVAQTRDGTWFGRRTLPVVRLAFGSGRPY